MLVSKLRGENGIWYEQGDIVALPVADNLYEYEIALFDDTNSDNLDVLLILKPFDYDDDEDEGFNEETFRSYYPCEEGLKIAQYKGRSFMWHTTKSLPKPVDDLQRLISQLEREIQ